MLEKRFFQNFMSPKNFTSHRFIGKKTQCINGPVQFKKILFKCQGHTVVGCISGSTLFTYLQRLSGAGPFMLHVSSLQEIERV